MITGNKYRERSLKGWVTKRNKSIQLYRSMDPLDMQKPEYWINVVNKGLAKQRYYRGYCDERKYLQHVYFIQQGDNGLIKIGRSVNVKDRLRAINACCPEDVLWVRAIIPNGGPFVEKRLHKRFDSYRRHGEWFFPNPELSDIIKALHMAIDWTLIE